MTARPKRNYSKQADTLFSKLVRSRGVCQIATNTECYGHLQCCHGFSRRYRGTRWDFTNAWAGCSRHHQWWTAHPEEWRDWMIATLGESEFESLRLRAISTEKTDPKVVLESLKQVAA